MAGSATRADPSLAGHIAWIDWLRVVVVLLVFAFHSARVFDSINPFYAKSQQVSLALAVFVAYLGVWQMPLLFLLAGMSSYLALARRSPRQFTRERLTRLLIPFVFGVLVIVPPQGWYGARTNASYTGSFAQFLNDYFTLKWGTISDYLGGPSFGHLWFILFLFVVSLVSLPLLKWLRSERGAVRGGRIAGALARPWWWLPVGLALLLSTALPELGGHNIFTFFVWFTLGALLALDAAPTEAARRWRWQLFVAGTALAVAWGLTYDVRDRYPDPSVPIALNEFSGQLAAWLLCLAAIGIAKAYLSRPARALSYLAEASYPTYILHQTVIVAIGFYLVRLIPEPALSWPLLTVASLVVSYAVYDLLVRRARVMRFLFGMRVQPAETRHAGAPASPTPT